MSEQNGKPDRQIDTDQPAPPKLSFSSAVGSPRPNVQRVSDETIDRITRAVEETGYKPKDESKPKEPRKPSRRKPEAKITDKRLLAIESKLQSKKPNPEPKEAFYFRANSADMIRIRALADLHGTTPAEIVRQAISKYLDAPEAKSDITKFLDTE